MVTKADTKSDGLTGQPREGKVGKLGAAEAQQVAEVDSVVKQNAEADKPGVAKQRPREFSFMHKNPDSFESVETPDGDTFSVPAQVGSTYWGILKVLYVNANKKVFADDLFSQVAECMQDRDAAAWERYLNKANVKAYHKAEQAHRVKPANSAQDRVIGNAKTLTRTGGNFPYGKRLAERGHSLRYDHEGGKLYFILSTNAGTPGAKAE